MGILVTLNPPTPRQKRLWTMSFSAAGSLAIILTVWSTYRGEQDRRKNERERVESDQKADVSRSENRQQSEKIERDLSQLQNSIGLYFRNVSPPPKFKMPSATIVSAQFPAPTGLVVMMDNNYAAATNTMADRINRFLESKGPAPARNPGETDVDFLIRSNSWYASLMDEYKKQLGDEVASMVRMLISKGVLDPRVQDLAKDPVNIAGIRVLESQIREGGEKATPH